MQIKCLRRSLFDNLLRCADHYRPGTLPTKNQRIGEQSPQGSLSQCNVSTDPFGGCKY